MFVYVYVLGKRLEGIKDLDPIVLSLSSRISDVFFFSDGF